MINREPCVLIISYQSIPNLGIFKNPETPYPSTV